MVLSVDLHLFLLNEVKMILYGVKTTTKVDYIKNALWAAFGWKEGSFRLRSVDNDAAIDHDALLSSLVSPNSFDANGANVLRIDIVPGDDFVR